MITDVLILVIALSLLLFALQPLMMPERHKFASEVTLGVTQAMFGLFLLYFWWLNVSAGSKNSGAGFY